MEENEYERLIEFSEMAAFNFDSKEYKEVKESIMNCANKAKGLKKVFDNIANIIKFQTV